MRSNIKSIVLAVSLTFATIAAPVSAFAADATTGLQVLQNANLIRQVAHQARMVSQNAQDYAQQLAQYQTMLQNLKQFTPAQIAEKMRTYQNALRDVQMVVSAVNGVQQSADTAYQSFEARRIEMLRLNMAPEEYIRNEMQLAQVKGGVYKEKWERDVKAMQDLEEKSTKLSSMGNEISAIQGNVQGLQLLAQQNQAIATELVGLNAFMREQSYYNNKDSQQEELDKENKKKTEAEFAAKKEAINKAQKENLKELGSRGTINIEEYKKSLHERVF